MPITLVASIPRGTTLDIVGTVTLLDEDLPLHDAEFAPWVGDLFVAPEWRGQRVGTALLAAAVAASVALGVPSVSLYCDTAKPKLIEFYKRNGFAEVEVAVAPGSDAAHRTVQIMRYTG